MFGRKSIAFAKFIQPGVHFRITAGTLSINPFSAWAIQAGWVAPSALVGLILTIKVVGLFLGHGEYADPFTRYDAILPGSPISAVSTYDCTVTESRLNGRPAPTHFSCAFFPQDGSFDIIHVEGRNNVITELSFYATNVNLGQALLHWKPSAHPKSTGKTVEWDYSHYFMTVIDPRFDYQIPVRIINVRGTPTLNR